MKLASLFVLMSASVISLSCYAVNPAHANQPEVDTRGLDKVAIPGNFTSRSWIDACRGSESSLLAGCFANAFSISQSPIAALVNPLWSAVNTTPGFVANSVYIKKFPAGYTFTANSGKALTYNATTIPGTAKAWCTVDAIAENGTTLDCRINNDPNSATGNNCIYNLAAYAKGILAGATTNQDILQFSPGSGTALPIAIPFYVVCIGTDRTTGASTSILGMNVS